MVRHEDNEENGGSVDQPLPIHAYKPDWRNIGLNAQHYSPEPETSTFRNPDPPHVRPSPTARTNTSALLTVNLMENKPGSPHHCCYQTPDLFSLSLNPNLHQKCESLKGKNLKPPDTPEAPVGVVEGRRSVGARRTTQGGRSIGPRTPSNQPI